MSPHEAAALLNIELQEDIQDQIEFIVFELKQKIFRQLDQVLLYPKWFKELQRIERAAAALGINWAEQQPLKNRLKSTQFRLDLQLPMLAFFNQYQSFRKEIALDFHREFVPSELEKVLQLWLDVQKQYLPYWAEYVDSELDVPLSTSFDPQEILKALQTIKQHGIAYIKDLNLEQTPSQLKNYISWNQKIYSKLSMA
jgi:hypothetical protein